eukprot:7029222-Prorocentrum_lima.AAC.1
MGVLGASAAPRPVAGGIAAASRLSGPQPTGVTWGHGPNGVSAISGLVTTRSASLWRCLDAH